MFQTSAMDWPLSRDEKKSQLIRLYNDDVKAADSMVESGNKALEALREELDAVRRAAGIHHAKVPKLDTDETTPSSPFQGTPQRMTEAEVERLRQAVESAAAVLRAIVPCEQDDDEPIARSTPQKSRARSEGAERELGAVALRPALCRTPRGERKPKRKVSFGGQPEEEPAYDPEAARDFEQQDTPIILKTPPKRKVQGETELPLSPQPHVRTCNATVEAPASGQKAGSKRWMWLLCGFGIVALCGYGATQVGSNSGSGMSRSRGDPSCWHEGFNAAFCCNPLSGPRGFDGCWDGTYTFERCCEGNKEL
jgi:hypothetical protein